jgi:hypothetical protein
MALLCTPPAPANRSKAANAPNPGKSLKPPIPGKSPKRPHTGHSAPTAHTEARPAYRPNRTGLAPIGPIPQCVAGGPALWPVLGRSKPRKRAHRYVGTFCGPAGRSDDPAGRRGQIRRSGRRENLCGPAPRAVAGPPRRVRQGRADERSAGRRRDPGYRYGPDFGRGPSSVVRGRSVRPLASAPASRPCGGRITGLLRDGALSGPLASTESRYRYLVGTVIDEAADERAG